MHSYHGITLYTCKDFLTFLPKSVESEPVYGTQVGIGYLLAKHYAQCDSIKAFTYTASLEKEIPDYKANKYPYKYAANDSISYSDNSSWH